MTIKLLLLLVSILFLFFVPSYGQNNKLLTLEDILINYCVMSNDVRQLDISSKQIQLEIDNFSLRKLPTISFYLNPVNFTQSIVSLQDPLTGNFNYTNSYVNNSSLGLIVSQPIHLTGGSLQLNSSLNMMNQFSLNKNSFSSTPLRLSYNQPLIGGGKNYKFNREINRLKESNLSKIEKYNLYNVQKQCVELYMNLLICDISLNNTKINLSIADSIYTIAEVKQSLNIITKQDFLQAAIQAEQSKIEMINKEMLRDKALRSLLIYLNMNYQYYKVEIPHRSFTPHLSIDEVIGDAKNNNPNMIDLEIRKKEASRDVYSAKMQNKFNGDINLSYGLNQYGENIFLAYQHPSKQQSISLGLQIPIIDCGVIISLF